MLDANFLVFLTFLFRKNVRKDLEAKIRNLRKFIYIFTKSKCSLFFYFVKKHRFSLFFKAKLPT